MTEYIEPYVAIVNATGTVC